MLPFPLCPGRQVWRLAAARWQSLPSCAEAVLRFDRPHSCAPRRVMRCRVRSEGTGRRRCRLPPRPEASGSAPDPRQHRYGGLRREMRYRLVCAKRNLRDQLNLSRGLPCMGAMHASGCPERRDQQLPAIHATIAFSTLVAGVSRTGLLATTSRPWQSTLSSYLRRLCAHLRG